MSDIVPYFYPCSLSLLSLSLLYPPPHTHTHRKWNIMGAEIRVSSAVSPELFRLPLFRLEEVKTWLCNASTTARNSTCLCLLGSFFPLLFKHKLTCNINSESDLTSDLMTCVRPDMAFAFDCTLNKTPPPPRTLYSCRPCRPCTVLLCSSNIQPVTGISILSATIPTRKTCPIRPSKHLSQCWLGDLGEGKTTVLLRCPCLERNLGHKQHSMLHCPNANDGDARETAAVSRRLAEIREGVCQYRSMVSEVQTGMEHLRLN